VNWQSGSQFTALRTPWPIHFKLRTFIGIDSLTVCILFEEISIFHSRVIGKKVFTSIVIGQGVLNLLRDIRKIAYNLMNKVP
jgi:hypothetical protein